MIHGVSSETYKTCSKKLSNEDKPWVMFYIYALIYKKPIRQNFLSKDKFCTTGVNAGGATGDVREKY